MEVCSVAANLVLLIHALHAAPLPEQAVYAISIRVPGQDTLLLLPTSVKIMKL